MREGYKETAIGWIPEDWKLKRIGDFAELTAGATPSTKEPKYWGGNIPWMNSGEINLKRIKNVDGRITELGFRNSSTKMVPRWSILIALAGQGKTRGKVAVNEIELCTNQSLAAIMNLKDVDAEFLFQNLDSRYFEIRKMSTGDVGRGGLNLQIIKSISVALPPLKEQKQIASFLSTVDDKIDAINERITQTQQLKNGLMQQLLTKGIGHTKYKDSPLGEIPENWDVVKLGSLVTKVGSGITPKGGNETYLNTGIIFIRSQNVLVGKMNLSEVAYISLEQHKKMSGSKLMAGDVLLNITGASIGRSCIVPSSIVEGNVNQHVCIIRTKRNLDANFLCQILNSYHGQNQIEKFQAGGNREGLNFQQIRSFEIAYPPIKEQKKIAEIFSSVDEKLGILQEKKTGHEQLKKGLMQKLLTGQIRVNTIN